MMKQPFIKFGVTTLFSLLCSTFLHAQVVTDERMFSLKTANTGLYHRYSFPPVGI